MIYDVIQQISICERDELCTNHWIVRSLSNYAEYRQLHAKLYACIIPLSLLYYNIQQQWTVQLVTLNVTY